MAQPLKINFYVLVVNKATQFGISKKINHNKLDLIKYLTSPHWLLIN